MKVAIRYYTKTGNTKKLADSISEVLGVPAKTVATPVNEPIDILQVHAHQPSRSGRSEKSTDICKEHYTN